MEDGERWPLFIVRTGWVRRGLLGGAKRQEDLIAVEMVDSWEWA